MAFAKTKQIENEYFTDQKAVLRINGSIYTQYNDNGSNKKLSFRAWDVANVKMPLAPKRIVGYKYKHKYYTEYFGRRLPIVAFKTKSGKPVYKREKSMKILRLVKVPIWKRDTPPKRGLDLPPNKLDFSKVLVERTSSGPIVGNSVAKVSENIWGKVQTGPYTYFGPDLSANVGLIASDEMLALVAKLEARCYGKFLSKIKGSAVNLAQALGERKQTAALLVESAQRVASTIKAIKRGNFASAAKNLSVGKQTDAKSIANSWLMYQYGVKPLLSDLEGAVQVLSTDIKGQFDVIATVKEKLPFQSSAKVGSGTATKELYQSYYGTIEGECTVKYKARIEVTHKGIKALASLGLTNLVELGWELTPWSFVIDWFLPIGDYFHQLDALTGVQVKYAHKTVFTKEQLVIYKSYAGVGTYGMGTGWAKTTVNRITCRRDVLTTLPPAPVPRLSDNPITATRLANAIALLIQSKR